MLDSGAEGPGFKLQPQHCRVSLRQPVHTHCASVHQAAKLIAALLRVARVTAGRAESNGSLPPGLWLMFLQADCQEPGSAPEPYAQQSSMGYLYFFSVAVTSLLLLWRQRRLSIAQTDSAKGVWAAEGASAKGNSRQCWRRKQTAAKAWSLQREQRLHQSPQTLVLTKMFIWTTTTTTI